MIKSHIKQHLRHNATGTVSVVKEHDDRRQPQIKERRCGWCDTVIGTKHGEAPDDHADGICKNCLTAQLKEVGLDKRRVDRVYHYGMAKSGIRHPLGLLQKAARQLQGYIDFNGLPISVENRRGNIRQWYDPAAQRSGMTRMAVPYGYIRGTLGVDGDQYDVFVGPHRDAPFVYVVRQMKAPEFTEFDEEKALVGFRTQEEAVALYRRHYDDPRFFGSVRRIPFAQFRDQVMKTRQNGGRLEKAHVKAHLRRTKSGAVATVREHEDKRKKKSAAEKMKPTRVTIEQSLATHKDHRPKILRVKDAFHVNRAPYEIQEFQNAHGGTYEKRVYLPEAYTAAYMIQSGNSGVLARYYAEMSDGSLQGLDSALLLAKPEVYQKVGSGKSLAKLTDLFDKVWEDIDEQAREELANGESFLSRAAELAMHPSSVKFRNGKNPVRVLAGADHEHPLFLMSDGEVIPASELKVNAYGMNRAGSLSRIFTAPREHAFLTKTVEIHPSGGQSEKRVRGDSLATAMKLPYVSIQSPGYKASGYRMAWVVSYLESKEGKGLLEKSIAHAILGKFLTPKEQEAFDLKQRVSRPGDSFNLGQFMQGMRVELEHSDVTGGDALLTAKIVAAHLREREDYYTALAKIEKACAGVYLLRRIP